MKGLALFVCLWAAVAVCSCTKDEGEVSSIPSSESSSGLGQEMELTVSVTTGQTKATATFLEDVVESLQVFVFSEGILEAVGYTTTADTLTLRCFEGYKNIYAVVNHPEIEWTPDMKEEEVLETVLELTEDLNVMFGYALNRHLPLVGAQVGTSYRMMMSVRRVAVRIGLHSIINDSGTALTVERAFITNVVGDADFYAVRSSDDYSYVPEIWYNKTGMDSDLGDFLEELFCSELNRDLPLYKGVSYGFDEYFYCFPNPSEYEGGQINEGRAEEAWTPRWTRLVVQAKYNGVNTYYVVPIECVKSGRSYEVELTITGTGWARPYSEGSAELADSEAEESVLVKTRSCDGTAVIRFAGGCAEVREL